MLQSDSPLPPLVRTAPRGGLLGSPARLTLLFAGLISLAAFLAALFPFEYNYLWDEGVYLSEAENLLVPEPYYEEFSFRPPLLPIMIHLASYAVPLDLAAKLVTALMFAVGVFFLYLLGAKMFGSRAGLIAAGLMASSPYIRHWAHKVMTDVPSTSFAIISVYLLVKHVEDDDASPWSIFLSGAMLAVSMLTRFVMLLAGVCALCYFLTGRMSLRSVRWYIAGILTPLAPYFVWAQIRYGWFLRPLLMGAVMVAADPVPGNAYYLKAIAVVAGPVSLLGFLLYQSKIPPLDQHWRDADLPLLVWLLSFAFYLTSNVHKEVRYIVPAIPPLYLAAGWGFARLQKTWARTAALAVAAGLAVFTVFHLSYFDDRAALGEEFLLQRSAQSCAAAQYLRSRIGAGEVIYTNTLPPVVAYCSKKKTRASSPQDRQFYTSYPRNMRTSGYFVYFKYAAKEPSQEWLNSRIEFQKDREFGEVILYKYTYQKIPEMGR